MTEAATYYGEHEAEDAMSVLARWMGRNNRIRVVYHNGTAVDADIFQGIIRIPRMACASGITQEALMLLRGRVYHEAGHIDETQLSKDDYPKGALYEIWNALEDTRMEAVESDRHKGCEIVFRWSGHHYNRKIAESISKGKNAPLWEALVSMELLVRGIQPAWHLTPKAQDYLDAAYQEFIKVNQCADATECLDLAKVIYELLKDVNEEWKQANPPPPPQDGEPQEGEGEPQQGEGQGESGEGQGESGEESGEPQSGGSKDFDDYEKEKNKPGKGDGQGDASEEGQEGGEDKEKKSKGGKGGKEEKNGPKDDSSTDGEKTEGDEADGSKHGKGDKEEKGKGKGKGDEEDVEDETKDGGKDGSGKGKDGDKADGTQDDKGDDGDAQNGDQDGNKGNVEDDKGQDAGKTKGDGNESGNDSDTGKGKDGDEGEASDTAGKGPKEGGTDGDEDDADGDDPDGTTADGDGLDGKKNPKDDFKAGEEGQGEPHGDVKPGDVPYKPENKEPKGGKGDGKDKRDLEDEFDGLSREQAQNEDLEEFFKNLPAEDKRYTSRRDLDVHSAPETTDEDKTSYHERLNQVSVTVASMTRALEQALRAMSKCRKNPYLRSGRIDRNRLVAIAKGLSKDVFYRTRDGMKLDTAVAITIDESGSMGNYYGVQLLAMAIGEALNSIGVPFEIIGTTTVYGVGDYRMPPMEDFTRVNPIAYKHYKLFGEQWGNVRHRMVHTGCYHHNVDGEVIEYAAFRLAQRPERRKVIFSLSDGEPDAGHENNTEMCVNLKRVCTRVRKQGIEVYSVSMGTDSPINLYGRDHSILVPSVVGMGPDIVRFFTTVLTQGRVKV